MSLMITMMTKKKELFFPKEELIQAAGIKDEDNVSEEQIMKAVDYVDGTLEMEYGDQDLESHICNQGIHIRGDEKKSPRVNRKAWEDGWNKTFGEMN